MTTFEYDLVALDLDGTLLNSRHAVSPANEAALRALDELGVQMVIVSGRMPAGILTPMGERHPGTECIAYSGALIYQLEGDRLIQLFHKSLPVDTARRVARLAENLGLTVTVFYPDRWQANVRNQHVEDDAAAVGVEPARIGPVDEIIQTPPSKLMLIADSPLDADQAEREINEQYGSEVECMLSNPTYVEVMAPGVSKGAALSMLIADMPSRRRRVLAIGDGMNDLAMLEIADTAVAMGNARQELKDIANLVTTTNDEDGVARALEQLGLVLPEGVLR